MWTILESTTTEPVCISVMEELLKDCKWLLLKLWSQKVEILQVPFINKKSNSLLNFQAMLMFMNIFLIWCLLIIVKIGDVFSFL